MAPKLNETQTYSKTMAEHLIMSSKEYHKGMGLYKHRATHKNRGLDNSNNLNLSVKRN